MESTAKHIFYEIVHFMILLTLFLSFLCPAAFLLLLTVFLLAFCFYKARPALVTGFITQLRSVCKNE